ncbi:stalk domain-containing protein [Bacillus toyonensis]|uniref:stalk domain-containing protein n=1 Tax=Bacillus toyonensis TaxID=155322 RepID=UPI002E1C7534|nr:stalk domain-containing protein [Bacillus toyonensis]
MFKKFLFFSTALLFGLLTGLVNHSQAATTTMVKVDGQIINFEGREPFVEKGATYVPVRAIAEKLGLKVSYLNGELLLTHPYKGSVISHKVGSSTVYIDSTVANMQAPSKDVNGVVRVPIRFFELVDAKVHLNASTNVINVFSDELRQVQFLNLASLAYDNLENFGGGTTFSSLDFSNKSKFPTFVSRFKSIQEELYMYQKDSLGNPINANDFMDTYLMDSFKILTFLTRNDFSSQEDYETFVKTDFQGYAFSNIVTGEIVIAFRGTDSFADKKVDATMLWNKGTKTQKYAEKLVGKVNQISPSTKFIVVGHSLGGHLAQSVSKTFSDDIGLTYTYNAPGLYKLFGPFNSKTVNYTVAGDTIGNLFSDYGREITFKKPAGSTDGHSLYNFYQYFFAPKTKYWNSMSPSHWDGAPLYQSFYDNK